MDNELILRQFDEIENKVETLIAECKALEETNFELRNQIKALEEELQTKVEAESRYAEQRNLIRTKIDSLLVKLEQSSEQEAG